MREIYHGVIYLEKMLESFNKAYTAANCYQGDILDLQDLRKMRFDIIICNQVIQYIEKEKTYRIL